MEGKPLPIIPENKQEEHRSLRSQLLHEDVIYKYETVRRHKDGTPLDCGLSAAAMYNESGEIVGLIAAIEDITRQNQAEKEQKNLEAQLRQVQKMEAMGRLAGGVAHDFNNHLTVMLGRTEMALLSLSKEEPMYETFAEIHEAAKRPGDLTRQLLAFARKQTNTPRMLQMNDTIEQMLSMLRRLIGEDIELMWLPADDLYSVRIDLSQVDQILANLLVNARDAIEGTGIMTIETQNAAFDEKYCQDHIEFIPGDYVMLGVTDNGCGMTSETRERIFDPFFTTKPEGEGTGLGLSTVYGIIKQNNGFINVYSEPGSGTSFRIYFPSVEVEQYQEKQIKITDLSTGDETILMVEDNVSVLILGMEILENLGYQIYGAATPSVKK